MQTQTVDVTVDDFRDQMRKWLDTVEIPSLPRDNDDAFALRRQWQTTLSEAGWLGVDWPVEYGGRGLSLLHQAAVFQELVRADAPFPCSIVGLYAVAPTLLEWATEEQKRRFLPEILSAGELWCQGFSEPDSGSDLVSLRTTAVADGESLRISGRKVWTSQAHRAQFCAVLARTGAPEPSRHTGISYIVVDLSLPGVTVRPIRQLTGDTEFNEVTFDDVVVPAANVVGPLGGGWTVAMQTLGSERTKISLQRQAEAESQFRRAARMAAQGRSVSDTFPSPATTARIGHARVQLAVLDGQLRKQVKRFIDGAAPSGGDSIDKLVLTEVEQEVVSLTYDLLGPMRLVTGMPVLGESADQLIYDYFYSRSWSISGGTTQIQRNIVAERVLGLPRT